LASARITARFMFGGTAAPAGVASNGSGAAVMCSVAHSTGLSARNGFCPVSAL
jgi:hypothetical protein